MNGGLPDRGVWCHRGREECDNPAGLLVFCYRVWLFGRVGGSAGSWLWVYVLSTQVRIPVGWCRDMSAVIAADGLTTPTTLNLTPTTWEYSLTTTGPWAAMNINTYNQNQPLPMPSSSMWQTMWLDLTPQSTVTSNQLPRPHSESLWGDEKLSDTLTAEAGRKWKMLNFEIFPQWHHANLTAYQRL